MNILEFSTEMENKDFLSTEAEDQVIKDMIQQEEIEKEAKEKAEAAKKKQKEKVKKEEAEIDESNDSHKQSEAALGYVKPKDISTSKASASHKEPLMPSKDAYELILTDDIPKPKKVVVKSQ